MTTTTPKNLFGYEVVERLGEGALSTIYVVTEPKTGQLRALKHVVPTDEKHHRFIDQLTNEYQVSRPFRHPGLRKCIDLKLKKRLFTGKVYEAALIMELVDGLSLEQALPETIPARIDVFLKVASALSAVHHYRILHCDTKPSNIILDARGNVKLIDFGQACLEGTTKTRIQGTPDFIAPEQARCRQLSYYTDVYNLGASLYWALVGRRVPTVLNVPKEKRDTVKEQQYAAPHEANPVVPRDLSELVMDCMMYKPTFRPQTMAEVEERLRPFGTPT